MDADKLVTLLGQTDLRSIGGANKVAARIPDQETFDILFNLTDHPNRILAARAMDAAEKVSARKPEWLQQHKAALFHRMELPAAKEIKWHLAQMLPRLMLNKKEADQLWQHLTQWVLSPKESRIVRVNALQGLFSLSHLHPRFQASLQQIALLLRTENIPSLSARLHKLGLLPNGHLPHR